MVRKSGHHVSSVAEMTAFLGPYGPRLMQDGTFFRPVPRGAFQMVKQEALSVQTTFQRLDTEQVRKGGSPCRRPALGSITPSSRTDVDTARDSSRLLDP